MYRVCFFWCLKDVLFCFLLYTQTVLTVQICSVSADFNVPIWAKKLNDELAQMKTMLGVKRICKR